MANEFMSFEEVLAELQIDEDELKSMVASGDLRGFRDGETMKFRTQDVMSLKKGRETEPTIILSDSDADISLPEESEDLDLLVEDEHTDEDRDTVLNIDVFESDDGAAAPDADSGSETVQLSDDGVELLPDEEEEDAGAATLIDVGGPEEMSTESFDLIEEAPAEDEDFEVVDTTITGSGRISRSARLRAMQIKKKKGHPVMTAFLFVTAALMMYPFAVIFNTLRGVESEYVTNIGKTLRDIIDGITSIFVG